MINLLLFFYFDCHLMGRFVLSICVIARFLFRWHQTNHDTWHILTVNISTIILLTSFFALAIFFVNDGNLLDWLFHQMHESHRKKMLVIVILVKHNFRLLVSFPSSMMCIWPEDYVMFSLRIHVWLLTFYLNSCPRFSGGSCGRKMLTIGRLHFR